MNATWMTLAEQILRSADWSVWAGGGAIVLFVLVVLIAALRADKSMANAMLALSALAAVGIAVYAVREIGRSSAKDDSDAPALSVAAPGGPALACLDGLAGEAIEAACESALFATPDMIAAAVSYTAQQLRRISADGGGSAPEQAALRRAVERDRYGFVAQVLTLRDTCTPESCVFFRHLGDTSRIIANMNAHAYDLLVARRATTWTASPAVAPSAAAPPMLAAPEASTGRPTNADFPSASSIPPVSIMNPEPEAQAPAAAPPSASAKSSAAPKAKTPKAKSTGPMRLAPTPAPARDSAAPEGDN